MHSTTFLALLSSVTFALAGVAQGSSEFVEKRQVPIPAPYFEACTGANFSETCESFPRAGETTRRCYNFDATFNNAITSTRPADGRPPGTPDFCFLYTEPCLANPALPPNGPRKPSTEGSANWGASDSFFNNNFSSYYCDF